ncbi:MAG: hypothetical protein IT325_09800 [Anaerolineae bacterium]|nr:hypothetical protein [Anaerolineae bacterium]
MSDAKLTQAQLIDLVAKGIQAELQAEIEKRLREIIDPIVVQASIAAARSVAGQVQTFDRVSTLETVLLVNFNGRPVYEAPVGAKDA